MARRLRRYGFSGQNHPQRNLLIILTIIALLLLTSGQFYKRIYTGLQHTIFAITAPLANFSAKPFRSIGKGFENIARYNDINDEFEKLTLQQRENSHWEFLAKQLIRENEILRARWKLPKSYPKLEGNLVVGRVIADLSGTFIDSLLIASGSHDSVALNDIALDNGVLIGRVVEVNNHYSRILLLTDINSRIPVIIGEINHRAILGGNNSSLPDILFPAIDAQITKNMNVKTSGHGGVFPSGIVIGKIILNDGKTIKVNPSADFSKLEYVDILNFNEQVIPEDTKKEIIDSYHKNAQ